MNDTDDRNDLELMRRLQSGDREVLSALYDRHTPLMLGVAMRILRNRADAEDTLQDVWVQVWNRCGAFDPRRGSVAAWLVTIARSRSVDRYRSNAARGRAKDAVTSEPVDPPERPEDVAGRAGIRQGIADALAALDPRQRQVIEIAYFEGLSQSEIAARLDTPLGTVKYWTRQGLLRLKELVSEGAGS